MRKKGHFQAFCRSKNTVGEVFSDSDSDIDQGFLGVIEDDSSHIDTIQEVHRNPWHVSLHINDATVEFKIDTGADISVVPKSLLNKLKIISLKPSKKNLQGPGSNTLAVQGKFTAVITYKRKKVTEDIYVIQNLRTPLLGRPAIEKLELLSHVNNIEEKSSTVMSEFPKLFKGLGSLEGEYRIELKPNATPFALSTPRRVAIPLMWKVKKELEAMEKMGIITRVNQPTDWCSGMVVVPKSNGKVRICVDMTKLNENVRRERHVLTSVEHTLAQLGDARMFSKLDANAGFWQIKLAPESALLTTFITPFGRFCFKRLPFGITSAPEYFQKRISAILNGQKGTVCLMDDILVHGKNKNEHDQRLKETLQRLEKAGITLNREKCKFSRNTVKFLGHVIDANGLHPDPDKVKAVTSMSEPTNITEVRRFLGIANQLSKFSPKLADLSEPLRALLKKKNMWTWSEIHRKAFRDLKNELSSERVLALYHSKKGTIVSADASSYGLGGVLLQEQSDGKWKPVMYASKSLTSTEQHYAQIEKEALGITWACERFKDFLIGKQFHIHTDHKPLIPLLSHKTLDELPVRIQRFHMRLMRFHFSISHVPGKHLVIADALSRAPVSYPTTEDDLLQQEADAYVQMIIQSIPATEK